MQAREWRAMKVWILKQLIYKYTINESSCSPGTKTKQLGSCFYFIVLENKKPKKVLKISKTKIHFQLIFLKFLKTGIKYALIFWLILITVLENNFLFLKTQNLKLVWQNCFVKLFLKIVLVLKTKTHEYIFVVFVLYFLFLEGKNQLNESQIYQTLLLLEESLSIAFLNLKMFLH